jgi:secreted trypsin-like serine protease
LIDKDYVITAAHCVTTTNSSDIILTAGMHTQSSKTETKNRQVRTVQQIYIHPEYDSLIVTNDIALLRVDTSFKFTKYVQPACLPGGEPQPNDQVTIIGWGSKVIGGTQANTLKQAFTTVIGNCDTYWPQVDNSRQICVANSISGDSACQGDSGGPILHLFQSQYVVSGVASYVKDCNTQGNNNKPNVYTRVSAYKTWIKNIIESEK